MPLLLQGYFSSSLSHVVCETLGCRGAPIKQTVCSQKEFTCDNWDKYGGNPRLTEAPQTLYSANVNENRAGENVHSQIRAASMLQ